MLCLILLIISSLVSLSFGCSCLETSPKELYCKADWVGIFKIVEKKVSDAEVEYKAGIVKMFKSSTSSLRNGLRVALKTPPDSGVCGIDWLQPKTLYLLSGHVVNRTLDISTCSQLYLDEWKKVPKVIKLHLKESKYEPCQGTTPK